MLKIGITAIITKSLPLSVLTPERKVANTFLSKFLRGLWPVFTQDARQGAIGEKLAAGLAVGTVVGLVGGIANPLNLCGAAQTRLTEATMYGHPRAKSGNVFRKSVAGCDAEIFNPLKKSYACGSMKPFHLFPGKSLREFYGRELRLKKNFIRIGIADAAEQPR